MKFPEPIKINPNTEIPENVKFFEVITDKMNNENSKSINFYDVLFCEKLDVKKFTPRFYIGTKTTGNKIGFINGIDGMGNFTFESTNSNNELYPNYYFNVKDFDQIYTVLSLSRDVYTELPEPTENWDNLDEVQEWKPQTEIDRVCAMSRIEMYLHENR